MKIAIDGASPLGVEVALHFHLLGSHVVIFGECMPGSDYTYNLYLLMGMYYGDEKISKHRITTPWGREIAKFERDESEITFSDYYKNYYKPIFNFLKKQKVITHNDISTLSKRFLSTNEKIENHSRVLDPFRIVYQKGHPTQIKSVETFEYFDIIIATPVFLESYYMGPTGTPALGERSSSVKTDDICYNSAALRELAERQFKSHETVLVVGSGSHAGVALKRLFKIPFVERPNIVWISVAKDPKQEVLEQLEQLGIFTDDLRAGFLEDETHWNKSCESYQKLLFDWRNLEDYERAKVKQPQPPFPRFYIKNLSNVTAVNYMEDRKQFYATIETPGFRIGKEKDEMEVLAFNIALVFTGHHLNEIARYLPPDEPGCFLIYEVNNIESKVLEIEKELFNFFTKT